MKLAYSRTALKALLRSGKSRLIAEKLQDLADNPEGVSANVTRLKGREHYRLRVQDWRVIFRFDGDTLWVDDIGPRGSVYEKG